MKTDIILAGVGGQGILSIATVIGEAVMNEGLYIKQAEIHGMSQRGGSVESSLRISSKPIYCDLIAEGTADVIISLEPMEALRYTPYLSPEGWIITSSNLFANVPDYPEAKILATELAKYPNVIQIDVDALAIENNMRKSGNMILLGAASKALGFDYALLEKAVATVFASKGQEIVDMNIKALAVGLNNAK